MAKLQPELPILLICYLQIQRDGAGVNGENGVMVGAQRCAEEDVTDEPDTVRVHTILFAREEVIPDTLHDLS